LLSISQAKVPIIKVYLGDIQFDILFACMDEPKSAEKMLKMANLANSDAFRKLSKTTQNSLLGRIAC
jgi:poly(A) polymerase Pap1